MIWKSELEEYNQLSEQKLLVVIAVSMRRLTHFCGWILFLLLVLIVVVIKS